MQVAHAFNTHRNRARLFRRQRHCRYNSSAYPAGLPGTGWQDANQAARRNIFYPVGLFK